MKPKTLRAEKQKKPPVIRLAPVISQRRLRALAFARIFAENMDSGQAYREVYRPGENPLPTDKIKGDRLLHVPYVQEQVGDCLKPAMVALGVDQTFGLRRLIETIDSDITDYVRVTKPSGANDSAELMTLAEMKEALPLAKRRLIRKYKITYDQYGGVKSREIELEPKQPAMELLAKIRGWVREGANVISADEMMRMIEEARNQAIEASTAIRGEFKDTRTFAQLQRPKGLLPQAEAKDEGTPPPGNRT
jgi:hypothetical protein